MSIPTRKITTMKPLTAPQLHLLHQNLHPSRVATRSQGNSNKQLKYVEAWDIRAMLIRVFGYGGFSAEVVESKIAHESQYEAPNQRDDAPPRMLWRIGAICTVRLTIHQTGAVYTETAVASQSGPDWGEVADFAVKTAESDALKRAATNLGTQFGLSLYDEGTLRDVVRKVVAPGQDKIVEDIVLAMAPGKDGDEARARLQDRLKVHAAPEPEPTEPVSVTSPDVTPDTDLEEASTPEQAEADARQAAAVAALEQAEAKTGVRKGAKK